MQHNEVHVALLRHPSISSDQQVLLPLLQTSKDLAAAAGQQCSGQLAAVLCTDDTSQLLSFAQHWLAKHAGLLKSLELQLQDFSRIPAYDGGVAKWSAAVLAVADALLRCNKQRLQEVQLQSLSVSGCPADPLLLQLSPKHLTRLCAAVDFRAADSMQRLAGLTALRTLDLSASEPYRAATGTHEDRGDRQDTLAPLQSLVHLIELHLGRSYVKQLWELPPALQQLHVVVDINCHSSHLEALAAWLQQHRRLMRSLTFVNVQRKSYPDPVWEDRLAEVADAFNVATTAGAGRGAAAAAQPAAAAAAPATAAAAGAVVPGHASSQMQLAHWRVEGHAPLGLALQYLPATGSLTSLECRVDYGRAAHIAAVATHTGLRRLQLFGTVYSEGGHCGYAAYHGDDVLAPLAGLVQLTRLQLGWVRPAQLHSLPAQLQQLQVSMCAGAPGDGEEAAEDDAEQQELLQLGHLTALTSCVDRYADEDDEFDDECLPAHMIGPQDVFPPALQHLEVQGDWLSLAPLLPLQQLPQLQLAFDVQPPTAAQLAQLSTMGRLTELQLSYADAGDYDAATANAWARLPLRSLKLLNFCPEDYTSSRPLVMPLQVVSRLSALSQLTHLMVGDALRGSQAPGMHLAATPGQLAAALAPLTSLQELQLGAFNSVAADVGAAAKAAAAGRGARSNKASKASRAGSKGGRQHGADGVVALLQTLHGLNQLRRVYVELPLAMAKSDALSVAAAAQDLAGWAAQVSVKEQRLQVKQGFETSSR